MGFRNDEAAAVRELERQRTGPVYGWAEEDTPRCSECGYAAAQYKSGGLWYCPDCLGHEVEEDIRHAARDMAGLYPKDATLQLSMGLLEFIVDNLDVKQELKEYLQ